jgi:RNA polymerase-interacting CarD/CdnL/TRCF family regulator
VTLTIGNQIVYPHQGPCRVGAVVKKVVDGRVTSFYHLVLLDGSPGDLFVPLDKVCALGIRQLLKRSEIPKLLGYLQRATTPVTNWKQRASENASRFGSGSAFDLAAIVESLTELSETRPLAARDRHTLERARKLLICEISEVMGETRIAAEEQIDNALKCKKTNNGAEGKTD